MSVLDTIYDDARARVCALIVGLSPEQLDSTVPATPEWSARQLLAHLAGVASDAVHGRTEGWPGPTWTGSHVMEREGRAPDEVVAEWARVAPVVCEGIARRRISRAIVHDVLTHEADLREAFALGRLPADVVDFALVRLVSLVLRGMPREGVLVIHAGQKEWRGGDGEVIATVTVPPYELYRGLMSRRSRAQMRAWAWSGDAERYVDALPVFGPRNDDQPVG
jgi:uncharacterized protein (TIGR03083 family)